MFIHEEKRTKFIGEHFHETDIINRWIMYTKD